VRSLTVVGGGVELAVLEDGDRRRPTLVFIHGYPDTKEIWTEVLVDLVDSFHVVAYDVRGAGRSEAPRGLRAYDLDRLADDLLAVIATVSPSAPVHLIGHDWGAIAGWEFATLARFDGKLASFTAVAGPSLDQVSLAVRELLAHGRLLEALGRLYRSWYVLALCTPGVPTLAWRMPNPVRRWRRFLERAERVPQGQAHPAPTLARDATKGSNLYRRNIPRRLLSPRRNALARVPVQLIVPTGDRFISPVYYAEAERYAPGLRRRIVSASHWVPLEQPAQLARWVAEFVQDSEARERNGGACSSDTARPGSSPGSAGPTRASST